MKTAVPVLGLIAVGLCATSALVMAHQESGASRSAATKSLVAAYSFSDPAATGMRFADRSGHRGMAVGHNVRRAEGRFGRGLAFNGKNSSLTVAGRPVLDLSEAMTLSAWVKPQAANGTRTIVARLGRGGATYAVHATTGKGGPGGEALVARGTKRVAVPDDLPAREVDARRPHLRRLAPAPLPERRGGRLGRGRRQHPGRERPAADRRPGARRRVVQGRPRRGPRLQPRAEHGGDPPRHAPHARQAGPGRGAAPGPAAPPGPSASGVPAPSGDLPGWRQIFLEDFTQNVASWGSCSTYDQGRACSSLPEPLRSKWWAYPSSYQDTREKNNGDGGHYEPRNLSISNGMLQWPMRRVNGETEGAAPAPKIGPRAYGRYAVRFRMESAPGFKVAWLFWRASGSWGEIDFPEGELDGGICAFNHAQSGGNAFARCANTPMAGAWHTAVIEWTPGRITYYLDDQQFGTTTSEVPGMPMNWILQSETSLDGPPPNGTSANIYVNWVAAWAPA